MARDDGGLFVTKSIIVKLRSYTRIFRVLIEFNPERLFVYLVLYIDPHWAQACGIMPCMIPSGSEHRDWVSVGG